MTIIVKDEQGLGNALMMDGYTDPQICKAYEAIRDCFRKTAHYVFSEVLETTLPSTIRIDTVQNVPDRFDGEESTLLAYFDSESSHDGVLCFAVHERSIKGFLREDGSGIDDFEATIVHEMMHAAGLPSLAFQNERLRIVLKKIREYDQDAYFGRHRDYPQIALFNLLSMFGHYRAEGIAMLGEHLVSKQPFRSTEIAVDVFRRAYAWTLFNAQQWASGIKIEDRANLKMVHKLAYRSAPVILLKVLSGRGELDEDLYVRIMDGLRTGCYNLSEQEVHAVLKTSLELDLQEYILGLMTLGDDVAPIYPLLKICGLLQEDDNESNIVQFISLVRSEKTEETFASAMDAIMGSVIPEDQLDACYESFRQNPPDPRAFPDMQEKVEKLYRTMKDSMDPESKRIAQWALTYLFDDEDLIHDDIPGLGLVDDMAVIDCALEVLGRC